MKKINFILCIVIGLFICLSCSKDENDDYRRCCNCEKILTTDYYICPSCKKDICPSCLIRHSYGSGTIYECPKCRYQWNPKRKY